MERIAPQLPAGVEAGIGRFIANFALLEEYIRAIICEIARTSAPAGEILSSELSFRGLIACFGALLMEYVPDAGLQCEGQKILKEIDGVNDFRNQVVHSLWLPDSSSRTYAIRQNLAKSRKGGLTPRIERYRKADLVRMCDTVAHLTFRLSSLYEKIRVEQAAHANAGRASG